MVSYSIVEFPNKSFGVRRKKGFFNKDEYLSVRCWEHWWNKPEYIYSSCGFKSIAEAELALAYIKNEFKEI